MKKITFTVGIPTCYGGTSLVEVVKSLRTETVSDFELKVVADSIPISNKIKEELGKLHVDLTENSRPGSQIAKAKQMIAATKSDIFVFTQDDVRFSPQTLTELLNVFYKQPEVTMVAARILPEARTTWFEHVVEVGLNIVDTIASNWNRGDNYLSANGRCLAFRTSHLKKMRIPDRLVNVDCYLYLENERAGGKFARAENALVYNPSPKALSEQLRQTERFLHSKKELTQYFGESVTKRYQIPKTLFLKSMAIEFIRHPHLWFAYFLVYLLGYFKLLLAPNDLTPFWKVNLSTKK